MCQFLEDGVDRDWLLASYRLIDANILWVRDFMTDLPLRIDKLRTELCENH